MEENNIQEPVVNETPVAEQPVEEQPTTPVEQSVQPTVPVESEEPTETTPDVPTEEKKKSKLPMFIGIGVAVVVGIIVLVLLLTSKSYIVSFDTNGGSEIKSILVKKGKTVPKPKEPTKENYTFVEWQLDGNTYYFDEEVTKDITLKAKWEIHLTDEIYTITFDTRGANAIDSQQVNGNGQVTKPDDPERQHYKFVEWQLNGETYDFNSLVKEDMTLTAKYEQLPTYRISIDYDGGASNYNQEVYEGDKLTKPEEPKKTGYKFKEWQKDGKAYNFEEAVTESFTIKAVYEKLKQYTVSFNTDGGSTITAQSAYEGQKTTKPKDPTKDGYTFAGWQLEGKDFDFNTPITGDITLKAKWTEVKMCTVRLFDINTGEIFKLSVKCGSKITGPQVVKTIEKDCIETYGADKAAICCGNKPWLEYYDIEKDNSLEKTFDYNTIIDKDISLGFILGRGVDDEGNKC